VDFRIVAATNRDLPRLIAHGRFGQDLYERLAIVTVRLPRLFDRKDDIPALTRHFIGRFYERLGEPPRVVSVSPSALDGLRAYPWPGNIRELRNVIYQALVYKRSGDELLLSDLRRVLEPPVERRRRAIVGEGELEARIRAGSFNLRRERERLERAALRVALDLAGGQPGRAARLLGEVGRGRSSDPGGTVRAMMRRLRVPPPRLPGRARPGPADPGES
jgi:DNA-binding NtrC family response regulator